jgi:hypothetical protein
MNLSTLPEKEVFWLKQFFTSPNALTWDEIVSGNGPLEWLEIVASWLKFLTAEDSSVPLLLPVFDLSGPTVWYAMAVDARRSAQLSQELMSFVGPSYSDFDGIEVALRSENRLEQALKERFGRHVFRFEANKASESKELNQALALYNNLLTRRPILTKIPNRPIGQIRSEFDRVLSLGDAERADQLLDEFNQSGRLTAEQQKFLLIRRNAGLGNWDAIASDTNLLRVMAEISLPPQTLLDIVDALYITRIEPIEVGANAEEIFDVFRNSIARLYSSLFLERRGIRRPRFLRAFMLYECTKEHPNKERCQRLVNDYPDDAVGRNLILSWFKTISDPPTSVVDCNAEEIIDLAHQAALDEDFEAAVVYLQEVLSDKRAFSWVLRFANKSGSRELAQKALQSVDSLDDSLKASLIKGHETLIGKLVEQSKETAFRPQRDWLTWVSWVVEDLPAPQDALDVLEEALPRWSVDTFRRSADDIFSLSALINGASDRSQQCLRSAYPKLYDFFAVGDGLPAREFISLYSSLVTLIGISEGVDEDELELASSLAAAMLQVGLDESGYKELVSDLDCILDQNASYTNLSWALDTAEMLALHPAGDGEARAQFFSKVVNEAFKYAHRLDRVLRLNLELLAKDFGCAELLDSMLSQSDESNPEPDTEFAGIIGIYSLTVSAAQRAKEVLAQSYPKASIEINSDHVSTERLKSLVKRAEIMAFSWRSSKHQAYYAAKEARAPRSLTMVKGKGTSSIIRAVTASMS